MIHRIRQRRLLFMIRRLQTRRMDPMRSHAGGRNHHHPGHLLNEHVFHFGYFGLGPSSGTANGTAANGVRPSDSEENFGYIEPPPPYSYWKRPDQYCTNPPNEAPPTYEETISTNIPSFPAYYPAIGNNNNNINSMTGSGLNNGHSVTQQGLPVIQDYAVIATDQSQVGIVQLHAPPPEINCNSIPYFPVLPLTLSQQLPPQQQHHLQSLPHQQLQQHNSQEYFPAPQLVRHNSMPLRHGQDRNALQQQHRYLRQSIRTQQQQPQSRQPVPQPFYSNSERFFPNVRPNIAAAYNG